MKIRTFSKLGMALVGAGLVRAVVRRSRALELRGAVVAITGGSRGLGLVLARAAVARGAKVAICARDEAELERARTQLGGEVFAKTCDVTDRAQVEAFVAAAEAALGPIDALVNNAGIIQVGPLELMTHDDFEQAFAVNLRGPLNAMLAVLPGMRARKAGRIANIASVGGRVAVPHLAPYSASKFGLVGLSEAMRAEVVKDGVYVTTVCPGLMRTGSPRHAWFKGKQRAEYAWFSIGDSLPFTSVSAEDAAAQILDAIVVGDAVLTISPQAKLASLVHGIAPGFVAEVMGLVARLLPGAGEGASAEAAEGKDCESKLAPSWFTKLSDEAAVRNNELGGRSA